MFLTERKNPLKKRKAEEGGEIYLFRVTLSDWYDRVRGMPYRILAIPGECTLYELAESITDAFDFDSTQRNKGSWEEY